jgi:D-inositol-3-phosphate glycosyltransferase
MARVKNLSLAQGDTPEPPGREIGEVQVVEAADRLIANTGEEAQQLVELYGSSPDKVSVVPPGVDLELFRPPSTGQRQRERAELGVAPDAHLLLFVGRIQPLNAPDVLLRAVARLLAERPELRSTLVVAVVGGPSGSGLRKPEALQRLARRLHITDVVRFEKPQPAERLAAWYRSADVVAVPSYSESFGLVALEAQACGAPVVAAAVGGLREAVADGVSGLLVDGHDPDHWAHELGSLLDDRERLTLLSKGAVEHAATFGWDRTVDRLVDVYREARWSQSGTPALRLA